MIPTSSSATSPTASSTITPPPWVSAAEGRDEYRSRLPGFLARFPGIRYEVQQLVVDGPAVAAAYVMTATSDDHPVEVRGLMLFDISDGLINGRTDYWDSLGFLRQTGAA